MTAHVTALVAADVNYSSDSVGKIWVDSLVSMLTARGWTVHMLAREVDGVDRYGDIRNSGGLVVYPGDSPREHLDEHGLMPRFRARTIIAEAEKLAPDVVLVQGLTLSRYVAGSGRLSGRLWSIPLDRPYVGGRFDLQSTAELKTIAEGSARILVADETQRSTLDAEFPAGSSKVRTLPLPEGDVDSGRHDALDGVTDLHIHEALLTHTDVEPVRDLGQRLREHAVIPRMLIHQVRGEQTVNGPSDQAGPSSAQGGAIAHALRELPGAVDAAQGPAQGGELVPNDPLARHYALLLAQAEGRAPVMIGPDDEPAAGTGDDDPAGRKPPNPFDEAAATPLQSGQSQPLRLVIAGSDFKFAGDLVEAFLAEEHFDVRFDVFAHHSHAQPRASEPYLKWADVVLSEFAVQNAIWYSKNVAPHQTLIVHLHGFELLSDWITELDIDNVSAVVVASEFYRQKAHELRGWPLDKISVIPNSVNHFDFERPKHDDARFHLGLVGMVPILKRPDRALDLLENLLEVDPRYTLHIRGHAPWDYTWEWKKAAHQDAYRSFYARVGQRPDLLRAIAFEPFAPDMANWLRKIGWILSPSSRETFHLAAIEGATSGAVPLAWERDGARDIIGDEWTFSSTADICDFVTANNESSDSHRALADRAQARTAGYRSDVVGRQWRSIVVERHEGTSFALDPAVPRGVAGTIYREVDALVRTGDFDEAKGALDRHISVTKNDRSRLKTMEMFVRGLLALDSRRIDLIPPVPEPETADRFIRICALDPDTGPGRILADPRIITGTIGIVPFGYTGEAPGQSAAEAALRTVAGAARPTSTFSGPVVTDALEEHLDSRIVIDGALRFDRWVEMVSSEIRDHLADFPRQALFIDAPWHIGLPAAIAAGRTGVPFVWAPPVPATEAAVETLRANPYTGDLIAQFVGTLMSRAQAVVLPRHGGSIGLESSPASRIGNLVLANTSTVGTPGPRARPLIIVDSRIVADIADLAASPWRNQSLGALDSARPSAAVSRQHLRAAFVAGQECSRRLRRLAPAIDQFPLTTADDLDPTVDVLIVDESAVTEPDVIPGDGTPVQRVRALFDLARSFGIIGIFNAATHVGGDRTVSSMAEKADAVTGTKAVLTVGLLTRNPISVTRIGSTSVVADDASEVLSALAEVGIGRASTLVGHSRDSVRDDHSDSNRGAASAIAETWNPDSLRLAGSDGVSITVATRLGAERLPRMLASVSAQTMHPGRMELIIVHNGPRDESRSVVDRFAAENPQLNVRFLRSEVEGASAARNLGLQSVTCDYVTFLDDDDEIEADYILNLWLSADENVIVAAPLRDIDADGTSYTDIPNNRRLAALAGRRTQLTRASGLLGLNACKLIPSHVARQLRYPVGMRSGEDVAFMSRLLLFELELVPADTAPNSAYIRHRRPESVSRRVLTHDFAVDQRLTVIRHLEDVRAQGPLAIEPCIRALQLDQLSFVARYVAENPTEGEAVVEQVIRAGISAPLLRTRYSGLHTMALQAQMAAT